MTVLTRRSRPPLCNSVARNAEQPPSDGNAPNMAYLSPSGLHLTVKILQLVTILAVCVRRKRDFLSRRRPVTSKNQGNRSSVSGRTLAVPERILPR